MKKDIHYITKFSTMRTIISVDFDGVIHSYKSGWKGAAVIPDPPVEGAIEWLTDLIGNSNYQVVIFSTRNRVAEGRLAMREWFEKYLGRDLAYKLKFPLFKPLAHLYIDDRAFLFRGKFPTLAQMMQFKSWIQINKPKQPLGANYGANGPLR